MLVLMKDTCLVMSYSVLKDNCLVMSYSVLLRLICELSWYSYLFIYSVRVLSFSPSKSS